MFASWNRFLPHGHSRAENQEVSHPTITERESVTYRVHCPNLCPCHPSRIWLPWAVSHPLLTNGCLYREAVSMADCGSLVLGSLKWEVCGLRRSHGSFHSLEDAFLLPSVLLHVPYPDPFWREGKSNKAPTRPNYSILNFLRKHYINFYSSFFPVGFALLNSAH